MVIGVPSLRRGIVHPMFKELFIDSDANDLAAEQDGRNSPQQAMTCATFLNRACRRFLPLRCRRTGQVINVGSADSRQRRK